ncbi:uncharacterized protein [Haliotis cracherodii]|uniref:uncharacterized protein n=1 Tax=Haliotis cracherodii TaxID=6455 RepID=UPI0039E82C81
MTSNGSTHADDGPMQEVVPGGGQQLDVHFVAAHPQPDIHILFPSCPTEVAEMSQGSHSDPESTTTETAHHHLPPYPTNIPIIMPLDSEDVPESDQQYNRLPPYPLNLPLIMPTHSDPTLDMSESSDRHWSLPLFEGDDDLGQMPSANGGHPMPLPPVYPVTPLQVLVEPATSDTSTDDTHQLHRKLTLPQFVFTRHHEGVNHLLHLLVSILFCPWFIFWMMLCLHERSSRRRPRHRGVKQWL